jgi:hypothetical protein
MSFGSAKPLVGSYLAGVGLQLGAGGHIDISPRTLGEEIERKDPEYRLLWQNPATGKFLAGLSLTRRVTAAWPARKPEQCKSPRLVLPSARVPSHPPR